MPRPAPPLSLAYHGVAAVRADTRAADLFVRPLDIERQIQALRRWGYTLVTFGEQAARARHGAASGTASLTFDDGLADNYATLLPLLERLGAPATVFVVTGWLGGRHPHAPWADILTVSQLQSLHGAGVEIGAHTVTHPDLTALPAEQATAELAECRRTLEDILDAAVTVAAYPFGKADASTLEACRAAGYVAACRGPDGSWNEPLALPRQDMNYGGGVLGLRIKRRARYEPLMQHLPAKLARRIIRRGRETIRVVSRDRV